jgi:phage terminase large subunit-like protein
MELEFTYNEYVKDVISGKIIASNLVKQACIRHQKDLKNKDWEWTFDIKKANKAISFISLLEHTKGIWALKHEKFLLQPWQQFIVASTFGWISKDTGYRRFTKVYIEVARKNGKTALAAAMLVSQFFLDGEPGTEIYCAATKKDQAKIMWKQMEAFIKKNSDLKRMVKFYPSTSTIIIKELYSFIKPLGADSDTEDGLNPSGAGIDEYHAHKTNEMLEVLKSGMGARSQPLIIITTTAGTNLQGPCYTEERDEAIKVLNNILDGEGSFYFIAELDEDDDWADEKNAIKANPNYGISIYPKFIKDRIKEALSQPRKQSLILTKNFNLWVDAPNTWIDAKSWDALYKKFSFDDVIGRKCYVGVDLSQRIDLTTTVFVFPPLNETEPALVIPVFYMPKEIVVQKAKQDHVPYDVWAKQGWIELTSGNVVDQDYIELFILDKVRSYNLDLLSILYDPWNATTLVSHLQAKDVNMIEFGQGYKSMSPASKAIEIAIRSKDIRHNGNPVLSWNISNVEIETDPAGNIKPSKRKIKGTTKRIDGVIGLIEGYAPFGITGALDDNDEDGMLYSV